MQPPPPPGADAPAPPPLWGDPNVVRERLGAMVTDLQFARDTLVGPALSLAALSRRARGDDRPADQARRVTSRTIQTSLRKLRAEFDAMAADIFEDNTVRMPFLMSRATKL